MTQEHAPNGFTFLRDANNNRVCRVPHEGEWFLGHREVHARRQGYGFDWVNISINGGHRYILVKIAPEPSPEELP